MYTASCVILCGKTYLHIRYSVNRRPIKHIKDLHTWLGLSSLHYAPEAPLIFSCFQNFMTTFHLLHLYCHQQSPSHRNVLPKPFASLHWITIPPSLNCFKGFLMVLHKIQRPERILRWSPCLPHQPCPLLSASSLFSDLLLVPHTSYIGFPIKTTAHTILPGISFWWLFTRPSSHLSSLSLNVTSSQSLT